MQLYFITSHFRFLIDVCLTFLSRIHKKLFKILSTISIIPSTLKSRLHLPLDSMRNVLSSGNYFRSAILVKNKLYQAFKQNILISVKNAKNIIIIGRLENRVLLIFILTQEMTSVYQDKYGI